MKVAIIGAGPAGLACARELEINGISPVVYEQRHRPGELFSHSAAMLNLFSRPVDPVADMKNKYNIDIRPLNPITAITMVSPEKKVTVRGRLGYFFLRGHEKQSMETQLHEKLKAQIITNTMADPEMLAQQFNYVVVANGNYNFSRSVGIWTDLYPTNLIGGTVLGKFNTGTLTIWLDTRYSKTAYAYLCPMSGKRAYLGLVVPQSTPEEARQKWKLFWTIENHPYELISEVIVEHVAGFVYPHQFGNILFIGIAGGFLDPFLGFGMYPSIKSGVLAARAIAGGVPYEDLVAGLKQDMINSIFLRELFNKVDNAILGKILSAVSMPGIKQLIYNTRLNIFGLTPIVSYVKNILSRHR